MSSKKLLVLDLDGTLIPFDFFLDSLKVLPHLVSGARTALLLLFQVFKRIIYRIFKILVIMLAKVLNIPIDHRKKYLCFSISASFYSTIVGSILSNLRYYVGLCLLEGLRKRRDVWKIILKLCNE
jgi:hypothetical protein